MSRTPHVGKTPFVIDTDGACDDLIALQMCLAAEHADLCAVTTVAGAVPVNVATANVLATLDFAGSPGIPVHQGAEAPLQRDLETSQHILGPRGTGDRELPTPVGTADVCGAAEALVQLAADLDGAAATLVALGPLTNLAHAIAIDPECLSRFHRIVIMGTATDGVGNITDEAEFNTWADPEAAAVMFDNPCAVTVVGWEACRTSSLISRQLHETIVARPSPFGTFMIETTNQLREFSASVGVDGYDLADGLAMAIALDPTLSTLTAEGSIVVSTERRGVTTLSDVIADRARVTVVRSADEIRYRQIIAELAMGDDREP